MSPGAPLLVSRRIWWILQIVLGGIFVYAGLAKVVDPIRFASSLLGYQIIPVSLVRPLVIAMPWVEIGLGGLLIIGKYPRIVSGFLVGLLSLFTLLIMYAMSQGWIIDCGCFGSPRPANGQKVLENIVMLLIALRFYFYPTMIIPITEWRQLLGGAR
jgi:putative oxidoreductase